MIYQNPVENFRQGSTKVCPECGSHMNEQEQSYIQECDRCLSKKEEF
ncbi:protein YhfH [Bacillus sp. T3]|nr:protein YhfH [Bacillus sp. T3]